MTDHWKGDERRENGVFNVRSKILQAVDAENDPKQRNMLLLMLGVMEYNEAGFGRIERKLEAILKDETAIKKLVLNGHEADHHNHHQWLDHRIANDKYYTDLIARSLPLIEWIEAHRKEAEEKEPVCEWAKVKMFEEMEAKKDKKTLVMKVMEGAASHIGSVVAGGAAVWFAVNFLKS